MANGLLRKAPSSEELLVAIRAHCLQCSGGCRKEVKGCRVFGCNLYPFRSVAALGAGKKQKNRQENAQVSLFDTEEEAE